MNPNRCRPADGRKGKGRKEGMKNPELPVETNKIQKEVHFQFKSESANLFCICRGRKIHKVQIN